MPFYEEAGLKYFTLSSFDELGINHGFFSRRGGVSPQPWASLNVATSVGDSRENVIENRNRILGIFGKQYSDVFDTWQIHSDIVHCSESPRPVEVPHEKGDAVITSNPQIALMMVFADCVPVLFYVMKKNVCAIAHAGWQGTVKHIVCRTVEKCRSITDVRRGILWQALALPSVWIITKLGIPPNRPLKKLPEETERVLQRRSGKTYFDMWQANALLLERFPLRSIEIAGICTPAMCKHGIRTC